MSLPLPPDFARARDSARLSTRLVSEVSTPDVDPGLGSLHRAAVTGARDAAAWRRSPRSGCGSRRASGCPCASVALSRRSASTSEVIAATLAVSVLMVSAGRIGIRGRRYGHAVQHHLGFRRRPVQDLSVTKASISTTTPPRIGNRRLEVATGMAGYRSEAAKGRSEIR